MTPNLNCYTPNCAKHSPDKQIFSQLELTVLYTLQNSILPLLGSVVTQMASPRCPSDHWHRALPWWGRTFPVPLFSRSCPAFLLFWIMGSDSSHRTGTGCEGLSPSCQPVKAAFKTACVSYCHLVVMSFSSISPEILEPSTCQWCEDKY